MFGGMDIHFTSIGSLLLEDRRVGVLGMFRHEAWAGVINWSLSDVDVFGSFERYNWNLIFDSCIISSSLDPLQLWPRTVSSQSLAWSSLVLNSY